MSPELKAFYRAYRDWLDDGAPCDTPFARYDGLCPSLSRYCRRQMFDKETTYRLRSEMRAQFLNEGLDAIYPFGKRSYMLRFNGDKQHAHKPRIQWARKHAE